MITEQDAPSERISPLERDDPTRPSLVAIAKDGHAFTFPWSHKAVPILAGFDSERIRSTATIGPWLSASAFDTTTQNMLRAFIYERTGWTCSYRDGFSSRLHNTTDHLSGSLGIEIDVPFASASATCTYDRSVLEHQHGIQASRNSSCRVGRIVMNKTPKLSKAAKVLLNTKGHDSFRETYGDFYVAGYDLGADAGACLSAHEQDSSKSESLEVTVKVKVLFVEGSHTWRAESHDSTSSADFHLCAFNTFTDSAYSFDSKGGALDRQLASKIKSSMDAIRSLDDDVWDTLLRLDVSNGQLVPATSVSEICRAGVVAGLLLAPFARLNEYILHTPKEHGVRVPNKGFSV